MSFGTCTGREAWSKGGSKCRALGHFRFGSGGVVGCRSVPLVNDTLLLSALSTGKRGGGARPGVLFVLYSSVKCKSLKYCNRPFVHAPRVSTVTNRKVHFARTCTKDPIDTPSETSFVAKRRSKRYRMQNGGRC